MNFVNEILTSIDEASDVTLESMVSVYDSMLTSYEKMHNNTECYVEGFVQEADTKPSIMDQATGADKNESMIVKIIAFLPRLIMAILKKAAGVFSKDNEKAINNLPKSTEVTLEKSSEEELAKKNEQLQKDTNGIIGVVPKKKCFIVRGFTHLKNLLLLATTLPELLKLIKGSMQKKTFSWSQLAVDVKKFYSMRGKIGELLSEGNTEQEIIDKLKTDYAAEEIKAFDICDALDVFKKSGFALSAFASEAELFQNKKAWKQYTQGLDPTAAMHAESVCKTVNSVSFKAALGVKLVNGLLKFGRDEIKGVALVDDAKNIKEKSDDVFRDKFERFKNSSDGAKFAKYSNYDEFKKANKKLFKKSGEYKEFVEKFNEWQKKNDDEHIKLPTQGNIDAAGIV